MGDKLTVRVQPELLANAKRYAAHHDTTLTRLIENLLRRIPTDDELDLSHSPIVRRLSGIISADVTIEDYREHVRKKYGGA